MSLNANKVAGGGNRAPVEPMDVGTYPARAVMLIDLGVQEQRAFNVPRGCDVMPCVIRYMQIPGIAAIGWVLVIAIPIVLQHNPKRSIT